MKILVTGSSGLVGRNLVPKLQQSHVVYTTDLTTGLDLNRRNEVNRYFKSLKPDVVYHLAADAAESRGQISPISMTKNNSGIFTNVLTAAINNNVKRFIFTSSVAVYGEVKIPYKEDGQTIPKDVYGINKLACEQILKVMAKVYGFDYVIFRPHNIYGPHQNMSDPYKNVVALFMRSLMEGKAYTIYGEGKMRRAFSFVGDVVKVLIDGLNPNFTNQTVNVGIDSDISIQELSDLIQKITNLKAKVNYLPARPQEILMFLADHTLQNSLTTYPKTSIEEGLRKTWEWVKTQDLKPIVTKKEEICLGQA